MNDKPKEEPRIPLYLSMDNPEPMYAQIESQLRDFILADVLPPGTKLPSIRALASDLSCSVITTRRVYEDLEREGFILTRPGRGTVVAQIPEEKMRALLREPVERALREAVQAARRARLTEEDLHHILQEMLQKDETNVHRGGTS
jgi:DNA-binding transcriptional regulator YhcF (GntR family)